MNLCTYTSYVCIPLVFLYESMHLDQLYILVFLYESMHLYQLCVLVFLYESMNLYQLCVLVFLYESMHLDQLCVLVFLYESMHLDQLCVLVFLYESMYLYQLCVLVFLYESMHLDQLCVYTNLNLYIKKQNLTSPQCIWMVISLVALGLFLSVCKEERLLFIISTNTELFGNVFIFLLKFKKIISITIFKLFPYQSLRQHALYV